MPAKWSDLTRQLITAAIEEDLGKVGDLTAGLLTKPDQLMAAQIVAREDGIAAGLALVPEILEAFDASLAFESFHADGQAIRKGDSAGTIKGPHAAVLTAERTVLNFLGRMSGVATLTHTFVQQVRGVNANVQILDTRKTLPGWRELDKYAVQQGGGINHRMGLYDAVLIKDNHLVGVPIANFSDHVRGLVLQAQSRSKPTFIEIEVDTLEQFELVVGIEGIDYILLDNFSLEQMRVAVEKRDAQLQVKPLLEASGGITLESVGEIAATGVDRVSIGELTHSAVNFDWGLDC